MTHRQYPIPDHYDPAAVGQVWRVPYQARFEEARQYAAAQGVTPAADDRTRVHLLLVDVQNTFCIPDFELYVGGRSGTGAVDDNRRLCEFIYRNLGTLTGTIPTMDTHHPIQIFHSIFLINNKGEHPGPFTLVSWEEIQNGVWRFNPAIAEHIGVSTDYGDAYMKHYARGLQKSGKYDLTIWPYHAMLGGIGHALVSAVEQAIFFHGMARVTAPAFQLKGNMPLTENYSVLRPEVLTDFNGEAVAEKNQELMHVLQHTDALVVAGQAKSHCVAWTVADLLEEIRATDPALAGKVYLLEDCSSPVVIPEVIDYTDAADAAYADFSDAGMHVVQSTVPMSSWPGFPGGDRS